MYGSQVIGVKETTLAVLAGGKGRRLGGVHKGLIRLGAGPTLLERALTLSTGPKLVIANRPEVYAWVDAPLVADLSPGRGAPGGVVTALAMARTPWVLVLAVDMPFVEASTLEALCEAPLDSLDVVCGSRGAQLEPLVGLYRRELVHDWLVRLEANPSMRELVSSVRFEAVPMPAQAMWSLNEVADLRAAAGLEALAGLHSVANASPSVTLRESA